MSIGRFLSVVAQIGISFAIVLSFATASPPTSPDFKKVDWLRATILCSRAGEPCKVRVLGGPEVEIANLRMEFANYGEAHEWTLFLQKNGTRHIISSKRFPGVPQDSQTVPPEVTRLIQERLNGAFAWSSSKRTLVGLFGSEVYVVKNPDPSAPTVKSKAEPVYRPLARFEHTDSNGRSTVQSLGVVDRWAVVRSNNQDVILAYNSASKVITSFEVDLDRLQDGSFIGVSDQLPSNVDVEHLEYAPESHELRARPGRSSFSVSLLGATAAYDRNKDVQQSTGNDPRDVIDHNPGSQRIVLVTGAENTKRELGAKGKSDAAASRYVPDIREGFRRTLQSGDIGARQNVHLAIGFLEKKAMPDLPSLLLAQAVEVLETYPGERFFVHLKPESGKGLGSSSLAYAITRAMQQASHAKAAEVVFLLDFTNETDLNQVNAIRNALQENIRHFPELKLRLIEVPHLQSTASSFSVRVTAQWGVEGKKWLLRQALVKDGLRISQSDFSKVLAGIYSLRHRSGSVEDPLKDFAYSYQALKDALLGALPVFSDKKASVVKLSEEQVFRVASVYLRNVAGIPDPPPADVTERAANLASFLTTPSDINPTPVRGLDERVRTLQEWTTGYLRAGFRSEGFQLVAIAGPAGSGKNLTAQAVAKHLNGVYSDSAYTLIDFSALPSNETDAMNVLSQKVKEANGARMPEVILDNVHSRPDILKNFLSLLDDKEGRTREALINFSGKRVTMLMNLEYGAAFRAAASLPLSDPRYPSLAHRSIVETLTQGPHRTDSATADAIASRMVDSLLIYPDTNAAAIDVSEPLPDPVAPPMDKEFVRDQIRACERAHRVRILADDGTLSTLWKRAAAYQKGGKRPMAKVLRREINQAIAALGVALPGGDASRGPTPVYMLESRGPQRMERFALGPVPEEALRLIWREEYEAFRNVMLGAFQQETQALEKQIVATPDQREILEMRLARLKLMRASFENASRRSVDGATSGGAAEELVVYPGKIPASKQRELSEATQKPIRDVLMQLDITNGTDVSVQERVRTALANEIHAMLAATDYLHDHFAAPGDVVYEKRLGGVSKVAGVKDAPTLPFYQKALWAGVYLDEHARRVVEQAHRARIVERRRQAEAAKIEEERVERFLKPGQVGPVVDQHPAAIERRKCLENLLRGTLFIRGR